MTSADTAGTVVALWRYPVKSMAAELLDEIAVTFQGFAGDRRWAFVRPGHEQSGFPWHTAREQPDLARYRPVFTEPERPNSSPTVVHTPSGAAYDVADPALAAELGAAHVIRNDRGNFDGFPLSILTTGTLAALGSALGTTLDPLRFRPNLLIDSPEPFDEERWVGSVLQIGDLQMRVDEQDPRCPMINVDPRTSVRDRNVLKLVAKERNNCVGVYGSTVRPGRVVMGDTLRVIG